MLKRTELPDIGDAALVPGTWQISRDNKVVIPSASVKGDDGVLYLEGTKGEFKVIQP